MSLFRSPGSVPMRTNFALILTDFIRSAASFVIGATLIFVRLPTDALTQELQQLCRKNNGNWLEKYHECESLDRHWCESSGGSFDERESASRSR